MSEIPDNCPLDPDELESLAWAALVTTRFVVPTAHVRKLVAAGYVEAWLTGLIVTERGMLALQRAREDRDSFPLVRALRVKSFAKEYWNDGAWGHLPAPP